MKKEWIVLIGAAALAGCGFEKHLTLGGQGIQGSGVSKTETRTVGEFKSISLSGSTDVKWTAGAKTSVVVKGDDNLLNHLKTEVNDGSLKIYFDTDVSSKADTLVEITSPFIGSVSVAGSGDLSAKGIQAKGFTASVTGSGNMTLVGNANDATYSVTGSGDLDGSSFTVESATVSITGSGNVSVNSKGSLTANILGSGDISYFGDPKINQNVMGSGAVRKK